MKSLRSEHLRLIEYPRIKQAHQNLPLMIFHFATTIFIQLEVQRMAPQSLWRIHASLRQ